MCILCMYMYLPIHNKNPIMVIVSATRTPQLCCWFTCLQSSADLAVVMKTVVPKTLEATLPGSLTFSSSYQNSGLYGPSAFLALVSWFSLLGTLSTSMAPDPQPEAKWYLTPGSSYHFCSYIDSISVKFFSTPCKEQYLLWVWWHSCSLAVIVLINKLTH